MIRFAKYVHFLFFSFLKHMAIFRSFFAARIFAFDREEDGLFS